MAVNCVWLLNFFEINNIFSLDKWKIMFYNKNINLKMRYFMAFVYEKIPEEEKENLKIKLRKARDCVDKISKKKSGFFFSLDTYSYNIPVMWLINRENDIIIVTSGYCESVGIQTFLDFLFVRFAFIGDDIIIFETKEDVFDNPPIFEILNIYTKKKSEHIIDFPKVLREALNCECHAIWLTDKDCIYEELVDINFICTNKIYAIF